jgi:hypothetical protein
MRNLLTALPAYLALAAAPALAQPVMNGTIAGDPYGPAVSVQAVETGFGDNYSELEAAYCVMYENRLYLAITGNLEANFNVLEIFIDSKAGGENHLSGLPGIENTDRMSGLRFDTGFEADYHVFVRRGDLGGRRFDVYFLELGTASSASYPDVFGGAWEGSGATGTGLNAQPILVAFDNSNVAGVAGGSGAANQAAALAVQTGLELGINLDDLDHDGTAIRICAFVNGAGHNYVSNQFLGPLEPPQGNLGGDGQGSFIGVLDFTLVTFPGDQFFTCAGGTVQVEGSTWGRIKATYR